MKIQGLDAYSSAYVNRPDKTKDIIQEINKNGNGTAAIGNSSVKESYNDTNELLSRKEREFFINMFPESSEQISRHVLFNRNGKLQQQPVAKGMIIDGKA